MTKKKLRDIYNALSQIFLVLGVLFAFLMIFFVEPLSHGKALWVPLLCLAFIFLGLICLMAYSGDWFCGLVDLMEQRKEEKQKEKEEKEKEITYLEDFDYKKLAEEKAYLNDFDGPKDIEKFLVMLKRNHPQLNWVEAVYVVYLTGRYHEEIYKN